MSYYGMKIVFKCGIIVSYAKYQSDALRYLPTESYNRLSSTLIYSAHA